MAESFVCECGSGAGFEVALEGLSPAFFGEGEVGFEVPVAVLRGVGRFAGVVFGEALAEVFGEAGVYLCRGGFAAEEVDIEHGSLFCGTMKEEDKARFGAHCF